MRVKVTLLYFDGCPNWEIADSRLTEAFGLVGHPEQHVERMLIATDEEAQAARFRGSPTILIDGEDPFGGDGATAFGLTCRLYPTGGAPTVDELVAALAGRA